MRANAYIAHKLPLFSFIALSLSTSIVLSGLSLLPLALCPLPWEVPCPLPRCVEVPSSPCCLSTLGGPVALHVPALLCLGYMYRSLAPQRSVLATSHVSFAPGLRRPTYLQPQGSSCPRLLWCESARGLWSHLVPPLLPLIQARADSGLLVVAIARCCVIYRPQPPLALGSLASSPVHPCCLSWPSRAPYEHSTS